MPCPKWPNCGCFVNVCRDASQELPAPIVTMYTGTVLPEPAYLRKAADYVEGPIPKPLLRRRHMIWYCNADRKGEHENHTWATGEGFTAHHAWVHWLRLNFPNAYAWAIGSVPGPGQYRGPGHY